MAVVASSQFEPHLFLVAAAQQHVNFRQDVRASQVPLITIRRRYNLHLSDHQTPSDMLAMGNDHRISAQARIAASAPKTTYGKHKNKLLPLTGSQFLRNDILGTVEKRAVAKDLIQRTDQQSSADESPLSDTEPAGKKQSNRQVAARKRQPRAPIKPASAAKPMRDARPGIYLANNLIHRKLKKGLRARHHYVAIRTIRDRADQLPVRTKKASSDRQAWSEVVCL
jgi:hypothetical protein